MARRDRLVRQYLRTRFGVTMKSGQTWSGVMLDVDDRTLELTSAHLVNSDGTETPADGHIYLPRDDVAYMQTMP